MKGSGTLAKIKTVYICTECGYETPKWMGKCPGCASWNTLQEKEVTKRLGNKNRVIKATINKLKDIKVTNSDRIKTGIKEFDRVMGGGIVKDSVTIISAPPGMGKSTILLEVSNNLAEQGYKVLYASGEESDSQIKSRADRTVKKIAENIWIIADVSMDNIVVAIEDINPNIIIVDSIQTVSLEAFSSSRAGSPTQIVESTKTLTQIAKDGDNPKAVFLVGQMTKEDELGGPRTLEHLVDTVLYLEGETGEELRILRSTKNRFGDTGETGLFEMQEDGLIEIRDPSEYFITKRNEEEIVAGSALAVIKEGTRPIVIEVESLISKSFTPYPARTGVCLKKDQLNTLISILEQRGGIGLYDKNVVISTTGGLKLNETSVNLAVIMSIVSSVYKRGISSDTVFIAEVGLTGELKKVPSLDRRIRELDRMGFKKVIVPEGSIKDNIKINNIKIMECKTLIDVIKAVYN
ncbi:TPA: DNA repair protein RadA [Clostridium botulinum]|nr:DNA repair protein RadA [Clostridium botulinum]